MEEEKYLELLIDLHKDGKRQGPGGDDEANKIIELAGLKQNERLKIADIGCGTGVASIFLAKQLNANITAVDFLPEFIDVLEQTIKTEDLSNSIKTLVCSMDNLPFENEEYDVIWSEGAIYNIGFQRGVNEWKRFLKQDGLLILSEITWLTEDRPAEIQNHWDSEYPEIDTASGKIRVLEKAGYSPIAYFYLPKNCWLDNYYRPMQSRFSSFLERNKNSNNAQEIVEAEKNEIDLYERYKDYLSYGVYIARKTATKP